MATLVTIMLVILYILAASVAMFLIVTLDYELGDRSPFQTEWAYLPMALAFPIACPLFVAYALAKKRRRR